MLKMEAMLEWQLEKLISGNMQLLVCLKELPNPADIGSSMNLLLRSNIQLRKRSASAQYTLIRHIVHKPE